MAFFTLFSFAYHACMHAGENITLKKDLNWLLLHNHLVSNFELFYIAYHCRYLPSKYTTHARKDGASKLFSNYELVK